METKTCSTCKNEKDIYYFSRNKSKKDGYSHRCKQCRKSERFGFTAKILSVYRDMKSRTGNPSHPHYYYYQNLLFITKEEFLQFSLNDRSYRILHRRWKASGYNEDLRPSIDRIIPSEGYRLGNIRWVTIEENYKFKKHKFKHE